jgi:hypothetical protein
MNDVTNAHPFDPEKIGFFWRKELTYPPDLRFYELDHPDIDKSIEKDWRRFNVFLSKDGDYVTIWYGPVNLLAASMEYEELEGFELSAEQHTEYRFRGYIKTREEGAVIWNALNLKKYSPQYLGEAGPRLNHFK